MQSTPKMGLLETKTIISNDIDRFFDLVNGEILEGYRVLHLHRRKIGWWWFGHFEYVALLRKSVPKPDTKLKIRIGPVTNRPLPRLSLRVGVVSGR